jgi:predicted metal-dependent peptidase
MNTPTPKQTITITLNATRSSQLPLDARRTERLEHVLAFINYQLKFYACLLDLTLTIIVVDADHPIIQTAATDGVRLWINEAFLDSLTIEEAAFVICHEADHYLADDIATMAAHIASGTVPSTTLNKPAHPCYHRAMNVAMDAIHNGRLVTSPSLKMPSNPDGTPRGVLMADTINPDEHTWLDAYEQLMKDAPQPQPKPRPKPQPGTAGPGEPGDGGDPDPDSDGVDSDSPLPLDIHVINDLPDAPTPGDSLEKLKREQIINAASATAELMQPGSTPAHVKDLMKRMLADHQVPWTTLLRDLMRAAMTGPSRRDWTRMDMRRYRLYGTVNPPQKFIETKPIGCIIDTSESTDAYRDAFLAELVGLAGDMLPKSVTLIFVDTRVQEITTYKPKDFVTQATTLAGVSYPHGGGTALGPAFKALADLPDKPSAVVCLTDSENNDWGFGDHAPPLPDCTFICATTNPKLPHPRWFAHVVGIKPEGKKS